MARARIIIENDNSITELSNVDAFTANSICVLLAHLEGVAYAELGKSYEKSLKQQGREDAIEEFTNKFVCHDEDYDYPCICPSEIEDFAEQIKEGEKSDLRNR